MAKRLDRKWSEKVCNCEAFETITAKVWQSGKVMDAHMRHILMELLKPTKNKIQNQSRIHDCKSLALNKQNGNLCLKKEAERYLDFTLLFFMQTTHKNAGRNENKNFFLQILLFVQLLCEFVIRNGCESHRPKCRNLANLEFWI